MMRASTWLGSLGCLLLLAGLGCGGDDSSMTSMDAGPTGDAGSDAGSVRDAGHDSGAVDAGPVGCTENCELVELALGVEHSCVRRASGEVRCWGANQFGQLGDGNMRHSMDCTFAEETDTVDCSPPVTSIFADAARLTSQGAFSTCGMDDAGSVACWGWQGLAETTGGAMRKRYVPEPFTLPGAATDITDGWLTTCAVVGGEVYCIAENDVGQAGTGATGIVRSPTAVPGLSEIVDVETGVFGAFVCARSAAGVWCWGTNEHGELGDGRTDHGTCMHEGSAGFFDCATSPAPVTPLTDLGVEITQLSLGSHHACALTSDGTVYCWGQGILGQLGQGDGSYASSGVPLEVPGVTGVTQLASGSSHTCALLDTGAIQCWGAHDEGQLGDGVMVNGHPDTCDVGSNTYDCSDTPVDVATIDDATFIEAGASHTCAIRGTSEVWCWGENDRIQLGIGGTGPSSRERRVEPTVVVGIDDY